MEKKREQNKTWASLARYVFVLWLMILLLDMIGMHTTDMPSLSIDR